MVIANPKLAYLTTDSCLKCTQTEALADTSLIADSMVRIVKAIW